MTSLAATLERLRKQEGLTTEAFAQRLGISRSMWEKVRAGTRNPGCEFLGGVLRAYPELSFIVNRQMVESRP